MHRSAPALFFYFDRVVILICTSLSAKITARVLGVWKTSLPRSGKEWEAAFLMHNASKKLSVGAEAVVLVVRMGARWRVVRVSAWGRILGYVGGTGHSAWCREGGEVVVGLPARVCCW